MVVFARCIAVSKGARNYELESVYLVEDGLGLTTITTLLTVITTLSLGKQRGFSGLVLGDLVLGVYAVSVCAMLEPRAERLTLLAILALAVGSSGLGYVDLS